ncbi:MAG: flagellar motor protein [bacterium]
MDFGSIVGLVIGIIALFSALVIETGSVSIVFQPLAFIVVMGGSIGAVMINFSPAHLLSAYRDVKNVFMRTEEQPVELAVQILDLSTVARQNGLLSIQSYIQNIQNPFLTHSIKLSLDINNTQLLKEILYSEIQTEEERLSYSVHVLEALGGYSPTFGVLGAVLGLIGVMKNLESPHELGQGIATAFIATLYGVGFANMLFLPLAGKLRFKLKERIVINEMIAEGILAIHNGENPALIEEKLLRYLRYFNMSNNFNSDFTAEEVF